MNRVRADLAFPPVFAPDNAPNTFRYNGIPPEGTATEPGLRVESALTESNDDIVGSSGNDLIRSYGGVDIVAGGDGDDEIRALPPDSPPSSTLSGGNGNDEIDANGATAATISGGDGDDVLTDAGTLLGEGGADTMTNHGDYGGFVGDLLDGGAGDDALVELPDSTDCPFTVADTNIGGPGRDTVYDDCGVQDVFELKDGESDKWHCGDFTGIAELDRSDVLVAPKLGCARGPDLLIKFPKIKKDTARFKPVSDNKAAVIECKLDKKKFKQCRVPVRYKNLKDGKHVFKARAVAGSLIGKVQKYRWKVK